MDSDGELDISYCSPPPTRRTAGNRDGVSSEMSLKKRHRTEKASERFRQRPAIDSSPTSSKRKYSDGDKISHGQDDEFTPPIASQEELFMAWKRQRMNEKDEIEQDIVLVEDESGEVMPILFITQDQVGKILNGYFPSEITLYEPSADRHLLDNGKNREPSRHPRDEVWRPVYVNPCYGFTYEEQRRIYPIVEEDTESDEEEIELVEPTGSELDSQREQEPVHELDDGLEPNHGQEFGLGPEESEDEDEIMAEQNSETEHEEELDQEQGFEVEPEQDEQLESCDRQGQDEDSGLGGELDSTLEPEQGHEPEEEPRLRLGPKAAELDLEELGMSVWACRAIMANVQWNRDDFITIGTNSRPLLWNLGVSLEELKDIMKNVAFFRAREEYRVKAEMAREMKELEAEAIEQQLLDLDESELLEALKLINHKFRKEKRQIRVLNEVLDEEVEQVRPDNEKLGHLRCSLEKCTWREKLLIEIIKKTKLMSNSIKVDLSESSSLSSYTISEPSEISESSSDSSMDCSDSDGEFDDQESSEDDTDSINLEDEVFVLDEDEDYLAEFNDDDGADEDTEDSGIGISSPESEESSELVEE